MRRSIGWATEAPVQRRFSSALGNFATSSGAHFAFAVLLGYSDAGRFTRRTIGLPQQLQPGGDEVWALGAGLGSAGGAVSGATSTGATAGCGAAGIGGGINTPPLGSGPYAPGFIGFGLAGNVVRSGGGTGASGCSEPVAQR